MVGQTNAHGVQGFANPLGGPFILHRRHGYVAGVIVGQHHPSGIAGQGHPDNGPHRYARRVDAAPKQHAAVPRLIVGIETQQIDHLILLAVEMGQQIVAAVGSGIQGPGQTGPLDHVIPAQLRHQMNQGHGFYSHMGKGLQLHCGGLQNRGHAAVVFQQFRRCGLGRFRRQSEEQQQFQNLQIVVVVQPSQPVKPPDDPAAKILGGEHGLPSLVTGAFSNICP